LFFDFPADFCMTFHSCSLLSRILAFLAWAGTTITLVVAFNLQDPHFKPARPYLLYTVIGFSLLSLYYFLRHRRGLRRKVGSILACVALTASLYAEAAFHFHKYIVLDSQFAELQQIGAHFIVGFEDWESIATLAEKGLVGGIYITRRNLGGETQQSLRQKICRLQKLRYDAGLPGLAIFADQEGGIVSHLSPLLPRRLPLSAVLASGESPAEADTKAYAAGVAHGQDLAAIGVTVNLSPVVDLKNGQPANPFDFHSRIEERAIAADPDTVTRVASAYIHGLHSQGIQATLKHFPGLGSVNNDTHHFTAALSTPPHELQQRDWLPFRKIAAQTNALMMLSHVRLPELDGKHPVSSSEVVIQEINRGQWQHEGILITDDLTMGAAYQHGLCTTAAGALDAGMDLLLLTYDHEKIYDALYCVATRLQRGEMRVDRLEQSRRRLATLTAVPSDSCLQN